MDMNMNGLCVIRNRNNKMFIGVDESSGGYPWECDFLRALKTTSESASEYRNTMQARDWDLYALTETDDGISWNKIEWDFPIQKRSWEKA
jgi:hypothetical protein